MSFSKIVLSALILITVNISVVSQNIDSLLEQLAKEREVSELIVIYSKIGNELRYAYPDSALIFYRKGLDVATKLKKNNAKANAFLSIGNAFLVKNDFDSASYYIHKANKLYKRNRNSKGVAQCHNSFGLFWIQNENLVEAKKYFIEAKLICFEQNNSALLSKVYNNLGYLFSCKHDFDSALFFYQESLKIKEDLNDYRGIGLTTNNIAMLYESISEFELAVNYLNQSYKIRIKTSDRFGEAIVLNNFGQIYESQGELNLALSNYQKSFKIMTELNKKDRIATLYNHMGSIYIKRKDFKTGFEHLQKGLELNRELQNIRGQIMGILALAKFYEDLKIYQNAIVEYKKALQLSKSLDDIAIVSEIHEGLYNTYEMFHRYDSALLFYKRYAHLNDSIFNTYSRRNIEKLEIEYQSLKKEKENQDLIRQNQIKEENLKRLLLLGGILLVVLASIIVFGFFSMHSRRKLEMAYKLVLDQRNSIQKQSYELTEAYKKLQEYSNFKEELTSMIVHDLKNPLNIILNVAKITNYPDKDQVMLQSGKQMLNLVMNILDVYKYEEKAFMLSTNEQFINSLIEKVINDLSFVLSEKSITITTGIDYDFKVNIDESAIERVLVNLLTNAIKFSPPGSTIQINTEPLKNNKFRLHIIDNGEGIENENIEQIFLKFEQRENRKLGYSGSTGIGLTYCKMAIEAHGGVIGVQSEVGRGSDFFIEMDYKETKVSEMMEPEVKENYLLLSRDNRKILYPYILALKEKDIYEVTDIRNILKLIDKGNKELHQFCTLIEKSVLNCNQLLFNELLELALSKE